MLRMLIVTSLSDTGAYYFLEKSYWAIEISNIIYFIAVGVGSYMWFLFVYVRMKALSNLRKSIIRTVGPMALMCIAILLNPVTNFFFSIDDALIYHRGPGVAVTWIVEWGYMITALVINIRAVRSEKRSYKKKELRGYLFFVVPLLVSAVIQMMIYGTTTTQIGYAFALLLAFVNNQQFQVQRDDLTGLNNKNSLLTYRDSLFSRGKPTDITCIMIDADEFKKINDSYGHLKGDQALCDISGVLKETASAFAGRSIILYRYAGDEFVVIGENLSEDEANSFMFRLKRGLDIANIRNIEFGEKYFLGLSMGCVSGTCHDEHDFDELMRRADEAMYQEKKAKHVAR